MAESTSKWTNICCNPFGKSNHRVTKKSHLRVVTQWMCDKAPLISQGQKICDACRKELAKTSELLSDSASESEQTGISDEDTFQVEAGEPLALVNKCLETIGETPITKRKLQSKKKSMEKVKRITAMMEKVVVGDTQHSDEREIIKQLKEKFSTATRSEKIQILTVLPKSWSIRKIQQEFGTSNFMARKAKELVDRKGILTTPDPKPGHCLAETTVDLVCNFYESDNISRIMPGKKDYISVRKEDGRVQIQKRLILCNLSELYRMFKDEHPTEKVGFSTFASLRPRHCILAGASGTHAVCVCTYHQNVKLMMHGARLSELTSSDGISFKTYHHCIANTICNPPQPACYLEQCSACPGTEQLKESLLILLDENVIENVSYQQWVTVDRSSLETRCTTSEEFVEDFVEKIKALTLHSFIATQQAHFYNECKSALKPGELLIVADFSENYSFVLQDSAQAYHWNNSQATVHPFVVYYVHAGEDKHLSFVVISDCLQHDTVAVYLFQKVLIEFLKATLPFSPKKIIYFSDGAASQYKNRKNFINLCNHEADFGIKAEWHFSATSHGKGASDGVGGTVKRLAARASLQRPYDQQIMTPFQLFQWAKDNIPGIVFRYCSMEEYEVIKSQLEKRFEKSRTIPGTRKQHTFIPISKDTISIKVYSNSKESKEEKVSKQERELEMDEISGYVTCSYDSQWWLAYVLNLDRDNAEVTVTFLHPHGPSRSYKYPSVPDILTIPVTDILSKVSPKTATGRVYNLTQKENREATKKLTTSSVL